jgi:hypothetical protein
MPRPQNKTTTRWKRNTVTKRWFETYTTTPLHRLQPDMVTKTVRRQTTRLDRVKPSNRIPIKTTESHHSFHHTEQLMQSQLQPSIFTFSTNNTHNHSRENTTCLHSYQSQENTDQHITEPTFISYTKQIHGWEKITMPIANGFKNVSWLRSSLYFWISEINHNKTKWKVTMLGWCPSGRSMEWRAFTVCHFHPPFHSIL